MKEYPTIGAKPMDLPIIAFDKLDGSNIRVEWARKRGLYKFGTRHHLLDVSDPILGKAVPLIQDKYGDALQAIALHQRWESAVFFLEFWGPHSFAGNHDPSEQQTVTLIDAAPYKKGILPPREFLRLFGKLDIPGVLYEGKAGIVFMETVRNSALDGMTFEGVVCKGARVGKNTDYPVMFKVKSQEWLDKLHAHCKGNEDMFNRLK